MKTLLPEHVEFMEAAETVAVIFNGLKRTIKEPDEELEGGFYLDTGEEGVPIDEPEPVSELA